MLVANMERAMPEPLADAGPPAQPAPPDTDARCGEAGGAPTPEGFEGPAPLGQI